MVPLYKPHIPDGATIAIDKVLQSGQIAGDGNSPEFEAKLREFLGVTNIVLTAEFSRSIEMTLRMAGVGPGDSVLLSPLACLATTMPILQTGARPIWCDIDPNTGNLNPDELPSRREPSTKALLVYHWVGFPGNIGKLLQTADQLDIKVVEDAGEALGAEYDRKRIGAHGFDYTVLSFSPVRHITTGEGAAIVFHEGSECVKARKWRRYGIPETGFRDALGEINHACDISVPGIHNYMNRLAAALGALQMKCLPGIVERHRANGRFFDDRLGNMPGIRLLSRVADSIPSYWVYCLLCDDRNGLMRKLREGGIYASTVHIRNDSYSCFGNGPCDLPGVAEFERRQLCIPCGWWVTDEDRERIAETIRRGW